MESLLVNGKLDNEALKDCTSFTNSACGQIMARHANMWGFLMYYMIMLDKLAGNMDGPAETIQYVCELVSRQNKIAQLYTSELEKFCIALYKCYNEIQTSPLIGDTSSKVIHWHNYRELAVPNEDTPFVQQGQFISVRLDSVVHVMGRPNTVRGFQRDSQGDGIRDNQLAVLEYEKATAAVRCNHRDVFGFSRRRFQIAGDRGVIEIRPMEPGNQLELSLAGARDGYKRGTQTVKLPPRRGGRYDGEFADLAKVIRGEKEFEWSYDHDLAVQETVLLASGMPLE